MDRPLEYVNEFNQEKKFWGERQLLSCSSDVITMGELASCPQVSVLNYNVLRQKDATIKKRPYCDERYLRFERRRAQLLREIFSYDADILCLQEIEQYKQWWSTHLSTGGYRSVYTERKGPHDDGVLIAYRTDLFQMAEMQDIDLNDVCNYVSDRHLKARAKNDNVALLLMLKPWETSTFPTALCVASFQLNSDPAMEKIRMLQAKYLCSAIEVFNRHFQVPVILAGSLNAPPGSDIYHVVISGRPRPVPQPPRRPERPVAKDPTASSITLMWETPVADDGPVSDFRITYRVAGNTSMEFKEPIEVSHDVNEYEIKNLCGGVQYEFKVSAKNAFGWGPDSPSSRPVATKRVLKSGRPQKAFVVQDEEEYDPHRNIRLGPSGKTPRRVDGSIRDDICPRPTLEQHYMTEEASGSRLEGLAHCHNFRSAYGQYEYYSEPMYTILNERYTGTVDYIFYSAPQLEPFQLLSLPELDQLQGWDPRYPDGVEDLEYKKPDDWDDKLKTGPVGKPQVGNTQYNREYMGRWAPPAIVNPLKIRPSLPNATYPSDHMAQMCVFACKQEELATDWN